MTDPRGLFTEQPAHRYWLLAALVVAVVGLVASVVPIPVPDGGAAGSSAIGLTVPFHVVGYAALAALLARGFDLAAVRRPLVTAAALATGYGAGIELLQATIPWRSFAVDDIALNAIGAAIGAGTVWLISRWRD